MTASSYKTSRAAMALWFVLAVVVFNVRFDWQARIANHAFVGSQTLRHKQGLPTLTINDAFRPKVTAAAQEAAIWFAAFAGFGIAATLIAARVDKTS